MANLSQPTLVLLPGLNNTGAVWDDVRAHLPAAVTNLFNIVAPTLPADPSVDSIADTVLANIDTAGKPVSDLVVVGYSFGGYVALALADRAPDRVVGLALVGSSPYADTESAIAARQATLATLDTSGLTAVIDASFEFCVHPDHRGDASLREQRATMAEEYGSDRLRAHLAACMQRPDRTTVLADPARPTLMITGSADQVIPTRRQLRVAGAAGVPIVEIADAGHLVVNEQPAAVAAVLSRWLTDLPPRPPGDY